MAGEGGKVGASYLLERVRLARLHWRTEGERLTVNRARSSHRRAGAKKPGALSASGSGRLVGGVRCSRGTSFLGKQKA